MTCAFWKLGRIGSRDAGVYVVAQGFLGALPNDPLATWAVLSLILISISATAAGVIRLVGPAGLGLSAALMVFVGNPFSGATSAPEMLPEGVEHVGRWLPPGAGASLLVVNGPRDRIRQASYSPLRRRHR